MPAASDHDAVLSAGDLVITASTLGHPPFPALAAAAAGAGFVGLSLWPEPDYGRAREAGMSDRQLRRILDDSGLVVQDVDTLVGWVGADDPGPQYLLEPFASCSRGRRGAGSPVRQRAPGRGAGRADRRRGRAVRRAVRRGGRARHGGYARALRPGRRAHRAGRGRRRAGDRPVLRRVLVDSWHHHSSGSSPSPCRASPAPRSPPSRSTTRRLGSGGRSSTPSMHERLPPGRGVIDLVGLVRTLREAGSAAPLTVEVFNDELWADHPPDALAQLLGESARALMAEASERNDVQ